MPRPLCGFGGGGGGGGDCGGQCRVKPTCWSLQVFIFYVHQNRNIKVSQLWVQCSVKKKKKIKGVTRFYHFYCIFFFYWCNHLVQHKMSGLKTCWQVSVEARCCPAVTCVPIIVFVSTSMPRPKKLMNKKKNWLLLFKFLYSFFFFIKKKEKKRKSSITITLSWSNQECCFLFVLSLPRTLYFIPYFSSFIYSHEVHVALKNIMRQQTRRVSFVFRVSLHGVLVANVLFFD